MYTLCRRIHIHVQIIGNIDKLAIATIGSRSTVHGLLSLSFPDGTRIWYCCTQVLFGSVTGGDPTGNIVRTLRRNRRGPTIKEPRVAEVRSIASCAIVSELGLLIGRKSIREVVREPVRPPPRSRVKRVPNLPGFITLYRLEGMV